MGSLIAAYLVSIVAGLSLNPLTKQCGRMWDRLFRDLPPLSGKWKTAYKFVDGGQEVDAGESAEIQLHGRWCTAQTFMQRDHNRRWKLAGAIQGRYWSGTVRAADKHSLSGAGVFQLKIWENGQRMEGYMMWWDGGLDRVYVTPYEWKKKADTPL